MKHKVTTFFFNSNIFPFLTCSSFTYYLIRDLRSHRKISNTFTARLRPTSDSKCPNRARGTVSATLETTNNGRFFFCYQVQTFNFQPARTRLRKTDATFKNKDLFPNTNREECLPLTNREQRELQIENLVVRSMDDNKRCVIEGTLKEVPGKPNPNPPWNSPTPPWNPNPPPSRQCPKQRSNCASNQRIQNPVVCTNRSVDTRCRYPSQDCANTAGFRSQDCRNVGSCPKVPRGVNVITLHDPQVCRSSGLTCHYNSLNEAQAAGNWMSYECQRRRGGDSPSQEQQYDCYTRERWSSNKRRWCCNNMGVGCNGPTIG